MRRQKLEGHRAIEPQVLGLIDNAHAAFTEFFRYTVMADGLADHDKEILPLRGRAARDMNVGESAGFIMGHDVGGRNAPPPRQG